MSQQTKWWSSSCVQSSAVLPAPQWEKQLLAGLKVTFDCNGFYCTAVWERNRQSVFRTTSELARVKFLVCICFGWPTSQSHSVTSWSPNSSWDLEKVKHSVCVALLWSLFVLMTVRFRALRWFPLCWDSRCRKSIPSRSLHSFTHCRPNQSTVYSYNVMSSHNDVIMKQKKTW